MYEFEFSRPTDVAAAVASLKADPEAKLLAGGQTFIPVLKQRLNRPSQILDLNRIGLRGVTAEGDGVRIGAMTTHEMVMNSPEVQAAIPGLAKMASWIGDIQVRHRGTMGGSLANNDPSACYPAAVLALGGTIVTDRREIGADDFFQGMFTTALEPDEMITAIVLPKAERSNYEKFRNPASRYAMVGVFVAKTARHGVRVAVTGAGQGGVFRVAEMEEALSRDFSAEAVAGIKVSEEGLNGDIHASAPYRAHLITVMAKRAVAGA